MTRALIENFIDVLELPSESPQVHLAIGVPNDVYRANDNLPRTVLPERGRIASGRGRSREECRLSCLGEAAELISCCEWVGQELISGGEREMAPLALPAMALNGFAPDQLAGRDAWNLEFGRFDWRPAAPRPDLPIKWCGIENGVDGSPGFAPADFLFIGRREPGDEMAVAVADSNGCASGPDRDSAKLAAVLELIERDATGRWWYGRRRRPPLDPRWLAELSDLSAWLMQRKRNTWLFDISSDIGVPVAAAVSARKDGADVALGFSCKPDWQQTIDSAITEMLQMEFSLALAIVGGQSPLHWDRWRRSVTMALPPLDAVELLAPFSPREDATERRSLHDLCAQVVRVGADVWFADMTRPMVGVPVFRALSTILCHYKPRFARSRLLAPDRLDVNPVQPHPATQVPLLI